MRTGQCTTTIQGYSNSIYAIAFSPKHQLMASGHEDQTIKLWKLNRDSLTDTSPHYPFQTLRGHTGRVLSVAFSADEQLLASASPELHRKTLRCRLPYEKSIMDATTGLNQA